MDDRQHLARIEQKLDGLTDVVKQVATQEQKIAALVETQGRERERLDALYKDIYGREGLIRLIDRNRWVVGVITFVSSSAAGAAIVVGARHLGGLL